jgi:hypothetical protein
MARSQKLRFESRELSFLDMNTELTFPILMKHLRSKAGSSPSWTGVPLFLIL